jgi:SAM-dependent methyltransferase
VIYKLKELLKRSTALKIGVYIYRNALANIDRLFKHCILKLDDGATHKVLSIDESLAYIKSVFNDYKKVSGKEKFYGKVLELGPGDSDGVGLLFLSDGASHVDLADRFYSARDSEQQKRISDCLMAEYPRLSQLKPDLDKYLTRYYGEDASGEKFFDKREGGYDMIVSRAVLEHVDDPELVIRKMYTSLNQEGCLIHKVDLRDHGMFSPGKSAVKFLEVPGFLYKLMTCGSGLPNRYLFHRYKQLLQSLNPNVKFFCTGLHGVDPFQEIYKMDSIPAELENHAITFIDSNKHLFAKESKKVPSKDLAISSFFFVLEK